MNELAKGSCLCGACDYEFPQAAVITVLHCHCKDCQKSTGSGKATIILVPSSSLSSRGDLKSFTVQGTEGAHVTRSFCGHCGSPLLSAVEEMPEVRMIKAGTLNDSSWVSVDASCWAESACAWSPVDTAAAVFDRNPILHK